MELQENNVVELKQKSKGWEHSEYTQLLLLGHRAGLPTEFGMSEDGSPWVALGSHWSIIRERGVYAILSNKTGAEILRVNKFSTLMKAMGALREAA